MDDNSKQEFIICSNCFKDEGLKIDAKQIGIKNDEPCKECKSKEGAKLTKDLTRDLCYRFFVRGTIEKCEYGGFPLIEMNEQYFNQSDIDVSPWLINDVKTIEKAGEIGLFYLVQDFGCLGKLNR